MPRIIIAICLVILLLLGSIFASVAFRRPPGRPSVKVNFVGFTNDASGMRLASFAISNGSSWDVSRDSHYCVRSPAGAKGTTFAEGWCPTGGSTLRAGSSEIVTIPAPTNQPSWRAAFSTRKDEGTVTTMVSELLIEGQKIGLPTRYRRVGYWISSDVIQEQP
jgi:hypothetical protein